MAFVQTVYANEMRAGVPGMIVNSETQNVITRTNAGATVIPFGQPVIRSGDHGCVLGSQETLEAVGAPGASAPAGATIGAVTVSAGAKEGVYHLTCVTAGATGKWEVEDPDGVTVGDATTGSMFNVGGLSFTITDSGTDPAIGEQFIITVTPTVGTADLDVLGLSVRDVSLDVSNSDTFKQYDSVPVLTMGVMWVTAGASVAAGGQVYWNPSTLRFTASTAHLLMPDWFYDSTGVNGDLVKVARR